MRIKCNPDFNEIDKSVTLNLNDKQWEVLRMSAYNGLWYFLRTKGGV